MNCIGVNYKKVPLEIRQRYAFSEEEQRKFHRRLKETCGCTGSVIVSTCNRSEIYFCGEESDGLISRVETELAAFRGLEKQEMLEQIYVYSGENALKHLFHVASGLDSMVLGEDEILRQVKDGYQLAQREGVVCNEINIAFQGAMGSAKSVKTETLLSKTPVSVGTLAANRIEAFLKETGGSRILLVGITGKIGSILAKNLYSKGITDIIGTSRKHFGASGDWQKVSTDTVGKEEPSGIPEEREQRSGTWMPKEYFRECFPEHFRGMEIGMVNFSQRYQYLDEADVIVSATSGPHYTILAQKAAAAMLHQKERLFIDLAVPRDIDRGIAELPACTLLDIDDFKRAAASNNEIKLRETDKAELILTEKLEETIKSIYMSEFMDKDRAVFAELKDKAFGTVFYQLKEHLSSEQLKALMEAMEQTANTP